MKKIKSIRESKDFKAMAKELRRVNGGNLTIAIYKEMKGEMNDC